jgi:hypothetical protein
MPGGERQIAINVAFGIEDDRLASPWAADQVGVLGKRRIEYLANEHGRILKPDWSGSYCIKI